MYTVCLPGKSILGPELNELKKKIAFFLQLRIPFILGCFVRCFVKVCPRGKEVKNLKKNQTDGRTQDGRTDRQTDGRRTTGD